MRPALMTAPARTRCICWSSAPPSAACAAASTPRSRVWRASGQRRLLAQGKTVKIICVGKKGYDILRALRRSRSSSDRTSRSAQIGFVNADAIGRKVIALFEAGEFDVCTLFYLRFKSVIAQIPTALQLIPAQIRRRQAAKATGAGRRRLRIRAGAGRDPRRPAAAQHLRADVPRAARKQRVVLRARR
jgi:hypothetical protein